ncbi:MAG: pyridoxal 5'-phosphate synthase glutaminase subunit PdxT [Chloroflexi bacterium]|nr:pyridoxal 5'-phosphate synthase glutaminase subunit PdxT [Chloroflexota bacterium]
MRIGVLALQGDFAEHAAMLRRVGAVVTEVRLPRDLEGLDGLVIPGGESTTISKLLAMYGLLEPLRRRLRDGLPVLGTCAGAIVLAQTAIGLGLENLGVMDLVVRRNAFGRQVDSFEADLPMKGMDGGPYHAVFIRAPLIESVGPSVDVLARLADGGIVAARQGRMLAISFHPELTGDTRFHEFFLRLAAETPAVAVAEDLRS